MCLMFTYPIVSFTVLPQINIHTNFMLQRQGSEFRTQAQTLCKLVSTSSMRDVNFSAL